MNPHKLINIRNKQRRINMKKDNLKNETTNSTNTVLSAVNFDYKLISNIQFDGIDHNDAPDYCDAYIERAKYDGEKMTEEQIELLNDDRDYVYEKLMDYLY